MTYKAKRVYDALPSPRDPRDFRMMAVNLALLPDTAMLPAIPILDQGQEGSCIGHGCAGARETLEIIGGNAPPVVPLSRAWIYYQARLIEGTQDQDSGAYVRDGCRVLQTMGVPTEDLFPYRVGGFKDVPPDLDLVEAGKYKIGSYARLNASDEVRASIAQNNPVVIGIAVYQSFETQVGKDGIVPIPSGTEQGLGCHCMFVSGYKPDPKNLGMFLFRAQNSWSVSWGDNGYGWLPQGYLNNPNLCPDMWQIAL